MPITENGVEKVKALLARTGYRHAEFERTSRGKHTLQLRDDPNMPSTSNSYFLGILSAEEQKQVDFICDEFNQTHRTESNLYERVRRAVRLSTYRTVRIEELRREEDRKRRKSVVVLISSDPVDPTDPPEMYQEFEYGKTEFDKYDYYAMSYYRSWLRDVCKWHNALFAI